MFFHPMRRRHNDRYAQWPLLLEERSRLRQARFGGQVT